MQRGPRCTPELGLHPTRSAAWPCCSGRVAPPGLCPAPAYFQRIPSSVSRAARAAGISPRRQRLLAMNRPRLITTTVPSSKTSSSLCLRETFRRPSRARHWAEAARFRRSFSAWLTFVLIGDSSTSHLLIGIGTAIAEASLSVRYTTTSALVNELAEAGAGRRLSPVIARYSKIGLLCLDEFGYLNLDRKGAKPLFQIFTEREECEATAVATNSPFTEWDKTLGDARLCAAIVDRIVFRCTSSRPTPTPTATRPPRKDFSPARIDPAVPPLRRMPAVAPALVRPSGPA